MKNSYNSTHLAIVLIPLLLLTGCGSNEVAKEPEPAKTDTKPKTEKAPQADNTDAKSSDDPKLQITEKDINKAKKQAKSFMKKFGPKLISDMAFKNVTFFREHFAAGRDLVAKKKYKEAISAFRESLATKPNDARTLAEIATASFLAGDLKTAEVISLLGLGRAFDAQLKKRLQKLLGDIAEKQGKTRQTSEYHERIGSIVSPVGPEPDLTKLCAALSKILPKDITGIECDPATATTISSSDGSLKQAAYLFVRVAKTEKHYILALQTEAGWFAVAKMVHASDLKSLYAADDKLVVKRFEFAQLVPKGPEEVVIDFRHTVNDCDPGVNEQEKHTSGTVLVCGLNNKTPKCLIRIPYFLDRNRIVLSDAVDAKMDAKEHTTKLPVEESYALKVDFHKGKVTVKKAAGQVPTNKKGLIGTHTLSF
ncbi:MAG: tetratricopeptide repeat protein [Deltaproteobacteria bacterium]|nr:tetratricopeptide repeat protein [Deltaproteobacteria bacterium]